MKINNPNVAKSQYKAGGTNAGQRGRTASAGKKSLSKGLINDKINANSRPMTQTEKVLMDDMSKFEELEKKVNAVYRKYEATRKKYSIEIKGTGNVFIKFRGIVAGVKSGSIKVKEGIEYAKAANNILVRRVKMLQDEALKRENEARTTKSDEDKEANKVKENKKEISSKKPNVLTRIKNALKTEKKPSKQKLETGEAKKKLQAGNKVGNTQNSTEIASKQKDKMVNPFNNGGIFGTGR